MNSAKTLHILHAHPITESMLEEPPAKDVWTAIYRIRKFIVGTLGIAALFVLYWHFSYGRFEEAAFAIYKDTCTPLKCEPLGEAEIRGCLRQTGDYEEVYRRDQVSPQRKMVGINKESLKICFALGPREYARANKEMDQQFDRRMREAEQSRKAH